MNLNRSRILDAARWRPPTRAIRVEVERNGKKRVDTVIERLASVRNIPAMKPSGAIVPLCLGNANAIAEDGVVPYAQQILQRKKAKGWIPWGKCPVAMAATGEIPARSLTKESLRDAEPCGVGLGHGPDSPCPHALEERAHRAEVHEARELARAEQYKAEAERDREQRDRHHDELVKAQIESTKAIRGALEAVAGKKPKGDV